MATYVSDFNLSVTRALRDQLFEALEALEPTPLTPDALAHVAKRSGVYQLFLDGHLVYVGKAASDLAGRLAQHMAKFGGRTEGLLEGVTFRCVYVAEDLDSLAPEKMLIKTLKKSGQAEWNTIGIGNNDPGVRRDKSLVKEKHFDFRYPIRLDVKVTVDGEGYSTVNDVILQIKAGLPYLFRYATDARALAELNATPARLTAGPATLSAGEWMEWLIDRLPTWSVVALPGYLIAYPGIKPIEYESRLGAWTNDGSGPSFTYNEPKSSDEPLDINEADDEA